MWKNVLAGVLAAICAGVISYILVGRALSPSIEDDLNNTEALTIGYSGPSIEELITYDVPDELEEKFVILETEDKRPVDIYHYHKGEESLLDVCVYNYDDKTVVFSDDDIMKKVVTKKNSGVKLVSKGDVDIYDASYGDEYGEYYFMAYVNKGGTWIRFTYGTEVDGAEEYEDMFWKVVKSVRFRE